MIQAESASLLYNDHGKEVWACREIDLAVKQGEFLGILGPSGSGKSSLLYLLSGLKTPTSGRVLYNGQALGTLSDDKRSELRLNAFGFIFQHPHLIGYLTASENVQAACRGKDTISETEELFESLGIGDLLHRRPHELSGGQRQRVCAARALVGGRHAIFADEPTAALDHINGLKVVDILAEHRNGGSLVMVTHDLTMLEKADRIVEIVDGSLVQMDRVP
jgi:putative ABC transport system ATP-binding protein